MIKKLDKLILKSFIGPFIATFIITLFVLVIQFFWLYIDDIVGKGVETITVFKLIGYVSLTLVPLALPLAILLSSIMTFGNLGETFELVALKSAGIPLLRFMRPLIVTSIFLCIIAFLFNNYFIPVANLKMRTLQFNIVKSQPAFELKEGVFYNKIDGYVIKVGKKNKDGSKLENIVIYEKSLGNLPDKMIVANTGSMFVSEDKKTLNFFLQNGWRYEERGLTNTIKTDYYRLGFKEYKKSFDITKMKLLNVSDSNFQTNYQMLSLRQLDFMIDSLGKINNIYREKAKREWASYFNIDRVDTLIKTNKPIEKFNINTYEKLIPDSLIRQVYARAFDQANMINGSMETSKNSYYEESKFLRMHYIEWHKKFSLSIACFVLFLIGAPLGSIIRKGGVGLPFVFALIFFMFFHLFNTFGEKFVKENAMAPVVGVWLSIYVLMPMGIFLTYKAIRDSNLFNKEFYYRLAGQFKKFLNRNKKIKES